MADSLVVPVPERLLALYAVTVRADVDDAYLREIRQSFDVVLVPNLALADAPLPGEQLLRAMGSPAAAVEKASAAGSVTIVQALGDACWPPTHELAARSVAGRLAADHDGVAVDLRIPRTLNASDTSDAEPEAGSDRSFRLVDWVLLPYSTEPDGLWFTTKGLGRFGLPELQTHGVPVGYTGAWGAVLSGIAHILLREQWSSLTDNPQAAFREVLAEQPLTLRDVALAYSDRARDADDDGLDDAARFRLELDPATTEDEVTHLSVLPPADFPGDATRWCHYVVATVFASARSNLRG